MLKQWVLAVAAVAVLAVFILSLVPFFVNAEAFRPTIESQLSSALGREVTMGHITFAILAGSLDAEDIFIADDPEFSSIPFIQAKKLNVGVEVLPIVFHHTSAYHEAQHRHPIHSTYPERGRKVEFLQHWRHPYETR